jgi:antitoxin (DNA-binding transcriptional repressor) of toxin-antitoxin stability system
MSATETISATEFEAKCLAILDRIGRRELERVVITEHGRVVAVLTPGADEAGPVTQLHGLLRGLVVVPEDADLTEPALDAMFAAESGDLHG